VNGSTTLRGHVARARTALRVGLGLALLVVLVLASVEAWSGVAYLGGLYGGLGRGVLPALFAVWVLLASFTILPAAWAAWPIGRRRAFRLLRWWLLPVTAALAAAIAWHSHSLAALSSTAMSEPRLDEPALLAALAPLSELSERLPRARKRSPPLATQVPARCAKAPDAVPVTLIAAFLERRGQKPALRCFQGEALGGVVSELRAALLARALRGPVQLELVSGWQRLSSRHGWLDGFKLRPGLDGVCHDRTCSVPWQLLSEGAFSTYRPLAFIPDLQFGVDPEPLRRRLGAPPAPGVGGLLRLTTRSYVIDLSSAEPVFTALARMRRRRVPVTDQTLRRAETDAEAYVVSAQQPDGRFRYTLDPMTGEADTRGFNLARQAGTTLVLCELGQGAESQAAIDRALAAFEPLARNLAELTALSADPSGPVARIGESALPLVSMLACAADRRRPLSPLANGLTRLMLHLQRADGGFAPALDWNSRAVIDGPEPLYASGQALMALVLAEQRQQIHPSGELPPYEQLHDAVERSMQFFAERYWSHPLRDFFFLEENWHCLAARAALGVHRHPGYERFCTDYVRFKSRLILSSEEGIDADFDGGFGFGNIVPPHNTGAAGFAEALAAAIAVLEARDAPTSAEQALLERVLAFLLRQQWSRENCFACATPLVIGGMSEHTHSAITRIDFAQHAWAALGHGRRVLDATLARP
jgi:hypothetical protein